MQSRVARSQILRRHVTTHSINTGSAQFGNHLRDRLSLQILHREVVDTVFTTDRVNRDDVLVVQAGGCVSLVLEALQPVIIPSSGHRQHFHGHSASQRYLFRLVHNPHSTTPDQPEQLIVPQLADRRNGQGQRQRRWRQECSGILQDLKRRRDLPDRRFGSAVTGDEAFSIRFSAMRHRRVRCFVHLSKQDELIVTIRIYSRWMLVSRIVGCRVTHTRSPPKLETSIRIFLSRNSE